jgi:ribosomal protein S18 acetylase RimI-like enzyme
VDGVENPDEHGSESHTLFLDAATWCERSPRDGLEFVVVREDSAVDLIRENLTVNAQDFDENAPEVDESTIDAFRSSLRGCAAITLRCDGVAVAAGMFTAVREGRCELVGITTLTGFRRQGFGAAVTSRLASAALDAGADTVFLTTGDEGALRTYRRLGFHA